MDEAFQSFCQAHAVRLARNPSEPSLVGSMRTIGHLTYLRTVDSNQPRFLPEPQILGSVPRIRCASKFLVHNDKFDFAFLWFSTLLLRDPVYSVLHYAMPYSLCII